MSSLILYVNSQSCIDTPGSTDSNFYYFFPELANSIIKYKKVSLLSISIPKTYYLVDTNNFFLNERETTIELSMSAGNYNTISSATVLSNLLSSNSPNSFVYTVSSDISSQLRQSTTGKYTYSIQANDPRASPLLHQESPHSGHFTRPMRRITRPHVVGDSEWELA